MSTVTIEKTKEYLVIKIPLRAVEQKQGNLSTQGQDKINEAISQGLEDIKLNRVFGPFSSVKNFKKALCKLPGK